VAQGSPELVKTQAPAGTLAKAEVKPIPEGEPLKDKIILVVEDSEDNQLLIGSILTEAGAQVEFAANGREGVERCSEKHFDVVIMDIQMPVMDGLQATIKLRAKNYQRPILALTANAMSSDRERYAQAGFDEYLMKPINFADLLEKVTQYATSGREVGKDGGLTK
jgi:hypothetical protein